MPPPSFYRGDFMSNKVPCGGFYLDDMLSVDENGKLGVNGGEPFKQLVTDRDGNVKWEDRLAYTRLKYIGNGNGDVFVKVSDEIPDVPDSVITAWIVRDNAVNTFTLSLMQVSEDIALIFNEEERIFCGLFAYVDGSTFEDITIDEKGVYLSWIDDKNYCSGIAVGEATKPTITFDGKIKKTIDVMYLPTMPLKRNSTEKGLASVKIVQNCIFNRVPVSVNNTPQKLITALAGPGILHLLLIDTDLIDSNFRSQFFIAGTFYPIPDTNSYKIRIPALYLGDMRGYTITFTSSGSNEPFTSIVVEKLT